MLRRLLAQDHDTTPMNDHHSSRNAAMHLLLLTRCPTRTGPPHCAPPPSPPPSPPPTRRSAHAAIEKRWTVFSTFWYLVLEFKYFAVPPAVRYLFYLAWRSLLQAAYNAHKALVLWRERRASGSSGNGRGSWQCGGSSRTRDKQQHAGLLAFIPLTPAAARLLPARPLCCGRVSCACPALPAMHHRCHMLANRRGQGGCRPGQPRDGRRGLRIQHSHGAAAAALAQQPAGRAAVRDQRVQGAQGALCCVFMSRRKRSHASALQLTGRCPLCCSQTGRVHMLPPVKKPFRRPTFFFLF